MSLAMKFGLMAADEAVEDAGWKDLGEDERARTGVSVGMAIPDLEYIAACDDLVSSGKSKKMGPYFVPRKAFQLFQYYLTIFSQCTNFVPSNHTVAITIVFLGMPSFSNANFKSQIFFAIFFLFYCIGNRISMF